VARGGFEKQGDHSAETAAPAADSQVSESQPPQPTAWHVRIAYEEYTHDFDEWISFPAQAQLLRTRTLLAAAVPEQEIAPLPEPVSAEWSTETVATVGADGQTKLIVRSVPPEAAAVEQGPLLPGDRRKIAHEKLRKTYFGKGRLIEHKEGDHSSEQSDHSLSGTAGAASSGEKGARTSPKSSLTLTFSRRQLLPQDEAEMLANEQWERSRRGESAVTSQVRSSLICHCPCISRSCSLSFCSSCSCS
jgi:hypothetical protein